MEKRGISQITGKAEIQLGEKAFYTVAATHPGEDIDKVQNALWKIYVKENGSWRELKPDPSAPPKQGREVPFTITNQSLVDKELMIEAYIYEPEKTTPPGMAIKVIGSGEKKIDRVELFMANDNPIDENTVLKYNQIIKIKVYTQNMPRKLLKLSLYDSADEGGLNLGNETNKIAEITKITNNNGFLWHEFILNAAFSKITNAILTGSSDKLYEYYVLVESAEYGQNASSIVKGKYKRQLGTNPIPETGRSVSIVSEPQEKEEEDYKCPRCKILSKEEIDEIFTTASENNKNALLEAFNDGNLKFEINTCLRKAHFFAQVLAEVGTGLELSEPESFNYSARRLKDWDYVSGTGWVKDLIAGGHFVSGKKASSPFSYFKTHHSEADLFGRKDLNRYNDKGIQAANSKEIANRVYADKNRGAKYKLGNTQEGDGWKFMGKGIIQVTGRSNYTEVNKRLVRKGYNFDIINNPDNVLKHKESVLTSMAFWYWKDLQLKSDNGGREVVDSITKIVNEATSTYNKRKTNFDKTYSIFQVEKCNPIENKKEEEKIGNWRMPIDNPMLCIYSQGGGEKPWHGSFGEKIRDGSANHSGCDLLAEPGTPVYACLNGKIERVYTSSSLAGRVVVVKITDKETFKSLKNNYQPLYKHKGEILSKGFDENGNIFLVFMHLSSFGEFKEGQPVKYSDIIGYTGISGRNGNNFETKNPHLHFEVNNVGSVAGLQGKSNPMVYFKFKTELEMSATDKKRQLEIKNKTWK